MLGNALIQIGIITGDKNDRIESNRRISFRSEGNNLAEKLENLEVRFNC